MCHTTLQLDHASRFVLEEVSTPQDRYELEGVYELVKVLVVPAAVLRFEVSGNSRVYLLRKTTLLWSGVCFRSLHLPKSE